MSEIEWHQWATWGQIAAAAFTAVALTFISAPYGRHGRPGWGPTVSNRLGWIGMELPAVAVFLPIYGIGANAGNAAPLALCALWQAHYLHRTFIYPFRLRTDGKRVALVIVVLGMLFNSLNAYINARQLSEFGHHYDAAWLVDPRFALGTLLFFVGYVINKDADRRLRNLRAPGETGYKVPHGGLYRWVSCPNYLGEIVEWIGFAIATWSLPGLAFALYTTANVGPRALAHHRWYREKFPDYPAQRRALIPYLV